jgi:hypothetical protein
MICIFYYHEVDFIEHKVFASKGEQLIKDYNLILQPDILIPENKEFSLKLMQDAIRLSAHILELDKTQLAGQLLGRLLSFDNLERGIIKQAKQWNVAPWLCPLTASLMSVLGTLLRTIQGHTKAVTDIVVTLDNQKMGYHRRKIGNLGNHNQVHAITVTRYFCFA